MSSYHDPPNPHHFKRKNNLSKIYFIGKQKSPREIQILNFPSFYDALQLLKFNHSRETHSNFSSVPLTQEVNLRLWFTENHLPLTLLMKMEHSKLVIEMKDKQAAAMDGTVLNVINCFLFQHNQYFCFLIQTPRRKIISRKKNPLSVIAESAKVESNMYVFTKSFPYGNQNRTE